MDSLIRAGIAILIFFIELSLAGAQAAVPSTGGDATGVGGDASYSIGQVAYTQIQSGTGQVSLGVQQPYIKVVVANEDPESDLTISLFPNPVQTTLQLKIIPKLASADCKGCIYALYDLSGMELAHGEITSEISNLDMEDVAEGIYFLEICRKGASIKTFKVIKTD